jgi:predicted Zn-dependent protease
LAKFIGLSLAALFSLSCVTAGRSGNAFFDSSQDPVFVPEAQEKLIGQQSVAAVSQQYKKNGDAQLQAYVSGVGKKLAAQSAKPGLAYSFTVLDDPMVNAFALPGGPIYVSTGILAKFKDEAELAAVLGHEISHIVKSHGIKRMQRQVIASVGLEYLMGLLNNDKAKFAAAFAGPATSLLFLRNGREAELESDELGMQMAAKAGYDPSAMIGVQQMLMAAGGKADPLFGDMLSSHPASEGRISQAQDLLPRFRGPTERGEARYRSSVLSRLK